MTGLTPAAEPLLSRYVDLTADIQTTSLLLCYFSVAPAPGDKTPTAPAPTWEIWLDEYRDLLDRWQMWEQRCILDIALASVLEQAQRPASWRNNAATVHVVCNSCQLPITLTDDSLAGEDGGWGGVGAGRRGGNDKSATLCVNCSAQLSRCSLCLTPLGCSNGHTSVDRYTRV